MSASESPKQPNLTSNLDQERALDAIPTSSTDASTTVTKPEAGDDPISSTSSEVGSKPEQTEFEDDFTGGLSASDINLIIMGDEGGAESSKGVSDEEFLNLEMGSVGKITEDVEDIVHDLENLLGEAANFDVSSSKGEKSQEKVAGFESEENLPHPILEENADPENNETNARKEDVTQDVTAFNVGNETFSATNEDPNTNVCLTEVNTEIVVPLPKAHENVQDENIKFVETVNTTDVTADVPPVVETPEIASQLNPTEIVYVPKEIAQTKGFAESSVVSECSEMALERTPEIKETVDNEMTSKNDNNRSEVQDVYETTSDSGEVQIAVPEQMENKPDADISVREPSPIVTDEIQTESDANAPQTDGIVRDFDVTEVEKQPESVEVTQKLEDATQITKNAETPEITELNTEIPSDLVENLSQIIPEEVNEPAVFLEAKIVAEEEIEPMNVHIEDVLSANLEDKISDTVDQNEEQTSVTERVCVPQVENDAEVVTMSDMEVLKQRELTTAVESLQSEIFEETNLEFDPRNLLTSELLIETVETPNLVPETYPIMPESNLMVSENAIDLIPETVVQKEAIFRPEAVESKVKPSLLTVNVDEPETSPVDRRNQFKITITKHSDSTHHSILKIYDPSEELSAAETAETFLPKSPRKSKKSGEHSPKLSPRSLKQTYSSSTSGLSHGVPKLTIKPIVKSDELSSPKLTIKIKSDDYAEKVSPKLTIKAIPKPEDEQEQKHSPKITIKPIVHEEHRIPKLTIKPVIKPDDLLLSPKITIKPILPEGSEMQSQTLESSDGKITLKIHKTSDENVAKSTTEAVLVPEVVDIEEEIKQERIILKINKSTLPVVTRKREHGDDGNEKLAKIKLKFSKEGGHAHIVPQMEEVGKRLCEADEEVGRKRFKGDAASGLGHGPTIAPSDQDSKLKEILSGFSHASSAPGPDSGLGHASTTAERPNAVAEEIDPLSGIPVFEISPETVEAMKVPVVELQVPAAPPVIATPRKRGRPRKVPLQVREDFKDPVREEEVGPPMSLEPEAAPSSRPKRSCRGPSSIRTTLGLKPRKPRGPGRGRGGRRGMGTRVVEMKPAKEPKLSAAKLKLLKESAFRLSVDSDVKVSTEDGADSSNILSVSEPVIPFLPEELTRDVPIYEEETRMSADTSSRAQTPAKQVVDVDESQSSVQSSATTESAKVRRGPRLEVHQEPEGAVISAEQLAEYSWGGGGPFMLQEQVAQFLGIKSFKRKYPGIQRRPLEMQERDFIRESGLASEAMCDLGLTAVNSADILDIMYSDFQPKYEEYCKHQRDRQAKDLTNKQKALSLAASQEKNKLDITEQAVQSAAAWNVAFNKARKEERKACMDLQTFTINYPKGRMKQINRPPLGNYPVALVPGQFTDYYKVYTPTEINNLPLNTMLYDELHVNNYDRDNNDDSQSDGSGSESDSSTSDSESSDSVSSDDCTVCSSNAATPKRLAIH